VGTVDTGFGINGAVTIPFVNGALSSGFVNLTVDNSDNVSALVQTKTGNTENDVRVNVFSFTSDGKVNTAL
jgi:hypothetical protein